MDDGVRQPASALHVGADDQRYYENCENSARSPLKSVPANAAGASMFIWISIIQLEPNRPHAGSEHQDSRITDGFSTIPRVQESILRTDVHQNPIREVGGSAVLDSGEGMEGILLSHSEGASVFGAVLHEKQRERRGLEGVWR